MSHRPFFHLFWLGSLSIGCSAATEAGLGGSSPRMGGSTCAANTECLSGLCLLGVCQNGQPGGSACSSPAGCASGVCQGKVCVGNGQGVPTGGTCTDNGQCASSTCTKHACAPGSGLTDGKSCSSAAECASGACTNGICGSETSGGTGGTSGGGSGAVTGGGGSGACSASSGPPASGGSGGTQVGTVPPVTCDLDGGGSQDQIGCSCTPGASRACYTGPSGTRGTGACRDGTQVCITQGELTGTYGVCTGAVTDCAEPPPPPSLCTNDAVNNEPEILAAYSPAMGQSVARNGQIKVWVNDEAPPFIAQNEKVDPTTGAVLTPGDRTGKAADGYLWEPALYIAPQSAETGGTPHFPQWIKGHYNNNPLAGKPMGGRGAPVPGTIGAPMDAVPAGTTLKEKYTDEYVWDVCALGLAPGTYTAEFVIHDGDTDRGVGCVTIVIAP